MTRLALALALCASPALAQEPLLGTLTKTERHWPGGIGSSGVPSTLTVHAPTIPGAFATITFANQPVHSMNEDFVFVWEDVEIAIHFIYNVDLINAERVVVSVPPGYVAVKPETDVLEYQTSEIHIFKWEGM